MRLFVAIPHYSLLMLIVSSISLVPVLNFWNIVVLEFDVILMFKIYYRYIIFLIYHLMIILFIPKEGRLPHNLRSHKLIIQTKFYASCDQFRNFFFEVTWQMEHSR